MATEDLVPEPPVTNENRALHRSRDQPTCWEAGVCSVLGGSFNIVYLFSSPEIKDTEFILCFQSVILVIWW